MTTTIDLGPSEAEQAVRAAEQALARYATTVPAAGEQRTWAQKRQDLEWELEGARRQLEAARAAEHERRVAAAYAHEDSLRRQHASLVAEWRQAVATARAADQAEVEALGRHRQERAAQVGAVGQQISEVRRAMQAAKINVPWVDEEVVSRMRLF